MIGVVAGAVGAGAVGAACGACGDVASFMGAFLSGLVIGGDPSNHTSLPGVRCEWRGSSGGNQSSSGVISNPVEQDSLSWAGYFVLQIPPPGLPQGSNHRLGDEDRTTATV